MLNKSGYFGEFKYKGHLMHIILGLLGTIVTILVLINRLSDAGIDIGWLNPFSWRRRRAWRKKYEGNPVFSLTDPLEVAGLLATSTAKIDGDLSKEEKAILLQLFQGEFNRSEEQASDLLMSSIYLFGDGDEVLAKPDKVMKNALENFTREQARSVMILLQAVADIDERNRPRKLSYLKVIESTFDEHFKVNAGW